LREGIILWHLVILAIAVSMVFGLSGCETASGHIASVEDMGVWNGSFKYNYALVVELKPTNSAQPGTDYVVELYEKNHLRETTTIGWNQPEINVLATKLVEFPVTESEWEAYRWEDVSHVFSVQVREPEGWQSGKLIPDPALDAAVRVAINKYKGDITKSDLSGLVELDGWNMGISKLTGLEYCSNLSKVNFASNEIDDVTPLSGLKRLTELQLGWNKITNISPLINLTNLAYLQLTGNPLDAASLYSYIPKLEGRGVVVE